jgi:hypothetical protein
MLMAFQAPLGRRRISRNLSITGYDARCDR